MNEVTLTVGQIEERIAEQQKLIDAHVIEANKQIASMTGALAVWKHLLAKAQEQEREEYEAVS